MKTQIMTMANRPGRLVVSLLLAVGMGGVSGAVSAAGTSMAIPLLSPPASAKPTQQIQKDKADAARAAKKTPQLSPTKKTPAIGKAKPKITPKATPKTTPVLKSPARAGTRPGIKPNKLKPGQPRPVGIQGHFSHRGSGSQRGFAGDGRPSNQDAADAIRNAAAGRASEGRISSITPLLSGRSCVQNVRASRAAQFIIHGSRFGTAANGRKVSLASVARHRSLAEARIISWSDTQIVAELPHSDPDIHNPGHYVVGLQNATGHWVSNINRQVGVCANMLEVTGRINIEHCAAGRDNVRIRVTGNGRFPRYARIMAVPGNDFALQYRIRTPATSSNDDLQFTPELVGVHCPGGAWSPAHETIHMGFGHARASQDFDYQVDLQTFSISMSALAHQLRRVLLGTTIHLNNLREANSVLRLSDALGGSERALNIPPVTFGPRTYYINDINLNGIGVSPSGNRMHVRLSFEDAGMEFIGTCADDAGCIAGAPDVQATMSVDVYLTLERYLTHAVGVGISYGDVQVIANPHAQADGVCLAVDFLCEAITDNYHQRIKNTVESVLTAELDNTRVRDQVANAMRPMLEGLRIGHVNSARVEGSNFVIRYIPAE